MDIPPASKQMDESLGRGRWRMLEVVSLTSSFCAQTKDAKARQDLQKWPFHEFLPCYGEIRVNRPTTAAAVLG